MAFERDTNLSEPRPPKREIEFDFHFRTVIIIIVFAFVSGFIGFFLPIIEVILSAAVIITAIKCIFSPQWIFRGRLSIPVGTFDAFAWISIAPILLLMGFAMLHGLPPTSYILTHPVN